MKLLASAGHRNIQTTFLRYKQRENLTNYSFQKFDLNLEMPQFLEFLDTTGPQTITNFAAQSEVAPSWENPDQWFQTNCVSLASLGEASFRKRLP